MEAPKYDIAVGDRIRVLSKRLRSDGLMDIQEFEAVVTMVDRTRFEYRAVRVIREENVLFPVTEGGFSRLFTLAQLNEWGILEILT